MAFLTAANSVFLITIPGLYDAQIQLQGYAADDAFATEAQELSETLMGIDGNLSGGFVHSSVRLSLTLQGDSPSNKIMDTWASTMKSTKEILIANVTIDLPGPKLSYSLVKGFLKSYTPISDVRKLVQPRKYMIEFQEVNGSEI